MYDNVFKKLNQKIDKLLSIFTGLGYRLRRKRDELFFVCRKDPLRIVNVWTRKLRSGREIRKKTLREKNLKIPIFSSQSSSERKLACNFSRDYLRECLRATAEDRLRWLEEARGFILGALPAKAKRAWMGRIGAGEQ